VRLLSLKLDVRSEVGKGTAFSLSLPAGNGHTAPVAGAIAAAIRQQHAPNARILLVEDNAGVRHATCLLLELEGYRVASVSTLAEALRHLREGNGVDLLISDYHLNDKETGIHIIGAVRETLGVTVPAILATGDTSAAIKHLSHDDSLRITSKPIQAEELLALLAEMLEA